MKHLFYLLFLHSLLACSHSGTSQQTKGIFISEADYDFGVIPDSVEILNHRFAIINHTSDTCNISHVNKSCGCTHLQLTNTIIAPFDTVFLDVEVDIGSNISFFERDITIFTDRSEPLTIYLRASRLLSYKMLTHDFPVKMTENLRLNTQYMIFGNVSHGDIVSKSINIVNTSNTSIHFFAELVDASPYMNLYYESRLKPNEVGRIIVMLDLSEVKDVWGEHKCQIKLRANNCELTIPVNAIFTEAFISGNKEKPRILVPADCYTVDPMAIHSVEFDVTNVGNAPLIIRNIHMSNPASKMSVTSLTIPQNEVVQISVALTKDQPDTIEIALTTNDPIEPYKILRIFRNSRFR